MAIEREVVYKLGVQSQPTAGKAFDDLTKKSQELQREANKAGQAVAQAQQAGQPGAGQTSAMGGAAKGGDSMAMMNAAAIMAMLKQAMEAAKAFGEIMKINQNEGMTTFDRQRAMADRASSASILGVAAKAWMDVNDALEGTAEKLRMTADIFDRKMTQIAAAAEKQSRISLASQAAMSADADAFYARELADRVGRDKGLQDRLFGTGGAAIEAGMMNSSALNSQREAAGQAWADRRRYQGIADTERVAAANYMSKQIDSRDIKDGDTQAKQADIAAWLIQALAKERGALLELEKAIAREQAAQLGAAKAEYEIRKSSLDLQKQQMGEAQKIADSFGALDEWSQRAVVEMNQELAAGRSASSFSDFERNLLMQSGFSQQFTERRRNEVMDSSVFRDALQASGRQDLLQFAGPNRVVEANILVDMKINEARLKTAIADALKDTLLDVEKISEQIRINVENTQAARQRQAMIK